MNIIRQSNGQGWPIDGRPPVAPTGTIKYPKRKTIRLKEYDYSQNGAYFITICAHDKKCLFGHIFNHEMVLNAFGILVRDEWLKCAEIRVEVSLDYFVIMPNHLHGIIVIRQNDSSITHEEPIISRGDHRSPIRWFDQTVNGRTPLTPTGPQNKSIGSLVSGFKSAVTKRMNKIRETPDVPVWQRNYYEHIIRNEESLSNIREYIVNNPASWEQDKLFVL